ncbi:LbetaH domain-containing protein [Aliterella atlantica]|uniref:Transferase n=1 Tax=Aliterella atlantica CENA595 TaxID=1618023 RepID=A0A0D8ZXF9_9CYAN|nr:hypothetical protein [Aliterella atlantica]KJH73453.1 hypothetical protein UH38_01370 [Aliterella atlantica CENA595]
MHLPPLQPISNSQFYVSGNVTVDPGAAIAPGVLLQADPDSEIKIASGVCIGMGAILHAHKGKLEIAEGTNVGTGVLIVGDCQIGANACIGSMTTIFNSSVSRGEVISPGSLIGDKSRQAEQKVIETDDRISEPEPNVDNGAVDTSDRSEVAPQPEEISSSADNNTPVYGQARLNQLLSTLLPHRQTLNSPLQNDNPTSNAS